jgi:PAS domain S-box-containing protein
VITGDERFVVTSWNSGAEKLFGCTAAEAVGRPGAEVISLEISDRERLELRARSADGGLLRFQTVSRRKDGTHVDVDATILTLRSEDGGIDGYLCIYRDASDRSRAAHAVRGAFAKARVLLVEDHLAVREAIAAAFERDAGFEVVGQAASMREARALLGDADVDVDVAMLDAGLPDGYGGDLIEELREANPGAQAVVLSASLDRVETARALQHGAAGVLNKTAHLSEVVDAVRRVRAGETLLPPDEVVELLLFAERRREQERDDRAVLEQLTRREREVLEALAEGLDSQQIADRLFITLRTERNHIANILAKLGVHSQLQALVFALRYGVVTIGSPGAATQPT